MADVLVDTSVWINFFRHAKGRSGDELRALLQADRVLLCGVVEMEIYQGLSESELHNIQAIFEAIPYIETSREDFIASGTLWSSQRKQGKIVPSTDCLIAELCIRHDLTLFSLDSHFEEINGLKRMTWLPS